MRDSVKIFFCKFTILIILILGFNSVIAQPYVKDLRVTGNSIQFIYSTLAQYNTGITLTGKTVVRIKYAYGSLADPPIKPNWELRVHALDATIAYEGSNVHDIPLTSLSFTVIAPGATVNNLFALSVAPQVLVSGGGGGDLLNPAEFTITISYSLPTMINKPEGLYFVNLYFLLVEAGG
jgi:hypothetical protein